MFTAKVAAKNVKASRNCSAADKRGKNQDSTKNGNSRISGMAKATRTPAPAECSLETRESTPKNVAARLRTPASTIKVRGMSRLPFIAVSIPFPLPRLREYTATDPDL